MSLLVRHAFRMAETHLFCSFTSWRGEGEAKAEEEKREERRGEGDGECMSDMNSQTTSLVIADKDWVPSWASTCTPGV